MRTGRPPQVSIPIDSRFGMLVTIEEPRSAKWRSVKVKCDCGVVKDVPVSHIIRGNIKSCGKHYKGSLSAQPCLSCGGPVSSKNTTGYCTRSEPCRTLGRKITNKSRREKLPGESRGVGRSRSRVCENCGGPVGTTNNTGYCSSSKECRDLSQEVRYARVRLRQNSIERIVHRIVHRDAKKFDIEHDLTEDYLVSLYTGFCVVPGCGKLLTAGSSTPYSDSPSLDRISPSGGYRKGNVRWICGGCNMMKRDNTLETLQNLISYIQKYQGVVEP